MIILAAAIIGVRSYLYSINDFLGLVYRPLHTPQPLLTADLTVWHCLDQTGNVRRHSMSLAVKRYCQPLDFFLPKKQIKVD
jgi:hypothetical protein